MNFIGTTLAYAPNRRVKPLEGCAHAFFDELRNEKIKLPNGKQIPPLFDFTEHERSVDQKLLEKVGLLNILFYNTFIVWDLLS